MALSTLVPCYVSWMGCPGGSSSPATGCWIGCWACVFPPLWRKGSAHGTPAPSPPSASWWWCRCTCCCCWPPCPLPFWASWCGPPYRQHGSPTSTPTSRSAISSGQLSRGRDLCWGSGDRRGGASVSAAQTCAYCLTLSPASTIWLTLSLAQQRWADASAMEPAAHRSRSTSTLQPTPPSVPHPSAA